MALVSGSALSTNPLKKPYQLSSAASTAGSGNVKQPAILTSKLFSLNRSISAVHAAEPAKNPVFAEKPAVATRPGKWTPDSWTSKKALQLPEYPKKEELDSVLRTIEDFPPIVFAGEARHLEERLGDAALGKAFLLQGGDCAESFKEFNANNIRDTFRILLQMGVVLMFGGQMPVIKVKLFHNGKP